MVHRRVKNVIFFAALLMGTALLAADVPGVKFHLQVLRMPEEKLLLSLPIHSGDRFYLDYTHSSDLTPVRDTFIIDESGTIILIQEEFSWYGAGLEFHPEADASISLVGDRTTVTLHRPLPTFLLRVGRVAGHSIAFNDNVVPLTSIAGGGDLVLIRTVDVKRRLHD